MTTMVLVASTLGVPVVSAQTAEAPADGLWFLGNRYESLREFRIKGLPRFGPSMWHGLAIAATVTTWRKIGCAREIHGGLCKFTD